jgi:hypothetical protein
MSAFLVFCQLFSCIISPKKVSRLEKSPKANWKFGEKRQCKGSRRAVNLVKIEKKSAKKKREESLCGVQSRAVKMF